eukprot:TRINITY_DN8735_c0_g1_i1.p1 TRINITY_DN8735_c0_g1~~TRINITY_DN8735_c0_g1_i1.p1  ORF type:complete len:1054 (+),score=376.35 TRINITY_DN8735_c0_g1_i1:84-3164(+)
MQAPPGAAPVRMQVVQIAQQPDDERIRQVLTQLISTITWAEQRGHEQDPQRLQQLLRYRTFLATRGRRLVSRPLLQALVGCVQRMLPDLRQPKRRDRLLVGFYSLRLIAELLAQGVPPSQVRSGQLVAGVGPVTEDTVCNLVTRALEQLRKQELLLDAPAEQDKQGLRQLLLGACNSLWLLLENLLPSRPEFVLRTLRSSMNDPHLVQLLAGPETFPLYFLPAVCAALHWLAKGDTSNWAQLTHQLAVPLLSMRPAPSAKFRRVLQSAGGAPPPGPVWLGALDLRWLTAYLMGLTDALTMQLVMLHRLGQLFEQPAPEVSWLGSVLWRRPTPDDFRRELLAAVSAARSAPAPAAPAAAAGAAPSPAPAAHASAAPPPPEGAAAAAAAGPAPAAPPAEPAPQPAAPAPPALAGPLWADTLAAIASRAPVCTDAAQARATRRSAGTFFAAAADSVVCPGGGCALLPPALQSHQLSLLHVCSAAVACAAGPAGEEMPMFDHLTPEERGRLCDAAGRAFVGVVLADELLFTDAKRTTWNPTFITTVHLDNHHRMVSSHRSMVALLLTSLGGEQGAAFVTLLRDHAKGVCDGASRVEAEATAERHGGSGKAQKQHELRKLVNFLGQSFHTVVHIALYIAGAQHDPRLKSSSDKMPPLPVARTCLEVLECYFPFFGLTQPPQTPQRGRSDDPQYRDRVRRVMQQQRSFRFLSAALSGLLATLTAGDRRFVDDLVGSVVDTARAPGPGGGPPRRSALLSCKLCWRLFALRHLAEAGPLPPRVDAELMPSLLRLLRPAEPEPVMRAAHQAIVELLRRPSPLALLGLPPYLHTCVPVRTEGTELAVDLKLLPPTPLLRLFTQHIRGLAQRFEEWDEVTLERALRLTPIAAGDEGSAQALAQVAARLAQDGDSGGAHPTGVGLVLYVAEALRITAMTLTTQSRGDSQSMRQRNLYIAALANLLQCLNPRVVTAVCTALERVLAALPDLRDVTFWLSYTSKAIKASSNFGTKQQVVQWFLRLQHKLTPGELGFKAKL